MEHVMDYLGKARATLEEIERMRRAHWATKYSKLMGEFFENHSGDTREFDSFEIAAITVNAMSNFGCENDSEMSVLELCIQDYIVAEPFFCTILKVTESGVADCFVELEHKAMEPLVLKPEVLSELRTEIIKVMKGNLDFTKKMKKLADKFRQTYHKYLSMQA